MKTFTIKVSAAKRGVYVEKQVPGYKVQIADFIEAFAHRSDGLWAVSEVTSGAAIAGGRTKKDAIEKAREIIANVGRENTLKAIQRAVDYQSKATV